MLVRFLWKHMMDRVQPPSSPIPIRQPLPHRQQVPALALPPRMCCRDASVHADMSVWPRLVKLALNAGWWHGKCKHVTTCCERTCALLADSSRVLLCGGHHDDVSVSESAHAGGLTLSHEVVRFNLLSGSNFVANGCRASFTAHVTCQGSIFAAHISRREWRLPPGQDQRYSPISLR